MRTLGAVGCAVALGVAAVARADEPMDEEAALRTHHRHHQHGGISQFVELALDTLGEEEARRESVEQVQDALHACMEPVEDKERLVFEALADGVAAGAVDAEKVGAAISAVTQTASESIHGCVAGPLNTLHGALLAPERAELGSKVRAHWLVWKQVNVDAKMGGKEPTGRLAEVGKQLGLSTAQVDGVAAALQAEWAKHPPTGLDPAKIATQVDAFAKAFAGTSFDARSVTTNSTSAVTTWGLQRVAFFYTGLTPKLTAPQRAALATHLRELAQHHPPPAASATPSTP